jgi:hypothetical protein
MNFKTIAAQIKDEDEFCGIPYLIDTLNRLDLEQIKISWPTIRPDPRESSPLFLSEHRRQKRNFPTDPFEILGHLLSLQEAQNSPDPEEFLSIFQPHFG